MRLFKALQRPKASRRSRMPMNLTPNCERLERRDALSAVSLATATSTTTQGQPASAAPAARAAAQLNVRFDAVADYGVKQIKVNGQNLLVGAGFGFIGSQSGADNTGNITTARPNNGGIMRPFNGDSSPYLPFDLTFRVDPNNSSKLYFEGRIGPSEFDFATVSMPMDSSRQFTHWRHSGSSEVRRYDQNPFAYQHEHGPVKIAQAPGNPSWGEIIKSDYTIRVTLTNSSRNMGLFFVNHPDTRNVEFSFGRVRRGEGASVSGSIQVSRTDPSIFNQPQLVFQAERDFAHQNIGRADGDGWSVNVRDDVAGRYLAYGPYTTSVRDGNRTATFRLMLDNVRADNRTILTIDVFDADTGRVVKTLDIKRRDFRSASTYQDFNLSFTGVAGHRFEFRTFWHGHSYAKLDKVTVK